MNRKLKNEELDRLSVEEFISVDKHPLVVVLDNIRSLNNIGSVFRTSDAFKVEEVILCGITAQPPHKDIQKTALGATESVKWSYYQETKEAVLKLKELNYSILGIEQTENSISLNKFQFSSSKKIAVIFGHEVKGIDQGIIDLCDECIEIPQLGTKHSLNISVATGIVLWEAVRNWI